MKMSFYSINSRHLLNSISVFFYQDRFSNHAASLYKWNSKSNPNQWTVHGLGHELFSLFSVSHINDWVNEDDLSPI